MLYRGNSSATPATRPHFLAFIAVSPSVGHWSSTRSCSEFAVTKHKVGDSQQDRDINQPGARRFPHVVESDRHIVHEALAHFKFIESGQDEIHHLDQSHN